MPNLKKYIRDVKTLTAGIPPVTSNHDVFVCLVYSYYISIFFFLEKKTRKSDILSTVRSGESESMERLCNDADTYSN